MPVFVFANYERMIVGVKVDSAIVARLDPQVYQYLQSLENRVANEYFYWFREIAIVCVLYGFVKTSLGTKLIENDKVYGEKMQNVDDD